MNNWQVIYCKNCHLYTKNTYLTSNNHRSLYYIDEDFLHVIYNNILKAYAKIQLVPFFLY